MTRQAGEHAIVIGASMGGLLAARALADHYGRVTVLERDALADVDEARKGVPQGRHAHGLLARGRTALEAFFPGFTDELVARGAVHGDLMANCLWFANGGYLRQAPCGLMGLALSRPMLEGSVRRRLLQLPNVRAVDSCAVLRPETESGGSRVIGVRVARHPEHFEDTLLADLVVDATGRGSRSPAWLQALGFDAPDEEQIEVGISYTTRLYRRRPEDLHGTRAVIVSACEPIWRAGFALAQEGDRWIVSLGGYLGDRAPLDERGFVDFARSLPVGEIHEIVKNAEPLSEFVAFRFPASVRHHYERLSRFPEGYLVFGDALCSFNPVYGQGMTVSALQAGMLGDCLSRGTEGLASRFFKSAARAIDIAWQIAAGNDLGHPRLQGKRNPVARVLNWYVAKLHFAARSDPVLAKAFLEVLNLMTPPPSLMWPAMVLRVLRGNMGSRTAGAGVRARREPAVRPP